MITSVNKVILVGFGYWGKILFPYLKKYTDEIIIVDREIENFNSLSSEDKSKTTCLTDLDTALLEKKVTHCFIATPEETHYDLARKCLLANKNVLVEKPLALTGKQANLLFELAKKNKLTLEMDTVFLFDPGFKKLLDFLFQFNFGKINKVYSVRHSQEVARKKVSPFQDLFPHDAYLLGKLLPAIYQLNMDIFNWSIKESEQNRIVGSFSFKNDSSNFVFNFNYGWFMKNKAREFIIETDRGLVKWIENKDIKKIEVFLDNKRVFYQENWLVKPAPLDMMISDFLFNKQPYTGKTKRTQEVSLLEAGQYFIDRENDKK